MMKKILLLTVVLLCAPALADETSVKKILQERLVDIPPDLTVLKTPFFDLYEVRTEGTIFYTDEQGTYLFVGKVLDGRTLENLTAERTRKINAIDFSKLPLNQAIPLVKGKGTRKMAYFGDPLCGYCRKLDANLAQLDDVTIYVFPYPILPNPNSMKLSRAAWCSVNPAKAWTDLMLSGVEPKAKANCSAPEIERNVQLGRELKIFGTPAMVFENNVRIDGLVPTEKLNQLLDDAARNK